MNEAMHGPRCGCECCNDLSSGAALIAAERKRQITAEGWTLEHDDEHTDGAMSKAAMSYVAHTLDQIKLGFSRTCLPGMWPWSSESWKPNTDPVRNLVKAGALIAAEIDRLKRLEAK